MAGMLAGGVPSERQRTTSPTDRETGPRPRVLPAGAGPSLQALDRDTIAPRLAATTRECSCLPATPLQPFGLRFGLWSRPLVAHPAVRASVSS
jgi:hypothetical protein